MAKKHLQILFVGAELDPLVKVGGLGDVMGSLAWALSQQGLVIRAIIPFYASINAKKYKIKLYKKNVRVDMGDQQEYFDLYQCLLPGSRAIVWLVKHRLFDYQETYLGRGRHTQEKIRSRPISDVERFVFFSKAVLAAIEISNWTPDLIHCHDWHSALVPTFVDEASIKRKNFYNIRTLFTIHNLASQGIAGLDISDYAGLHHDLTPAVMEDYYDQDGAVLDIMKIGILSADYVTTVSPSYAREILTKQYGEKLEKYLQRRRRDLQGIINGLDWHFFNPAEDRLIWKKYSATSYKKGKVVNKTYLQNKMGLPADLAIPIFGMVSRLFRQKGLDILLPALENVLKKKNAQVVILGSGQPEYEKKLLDLARLYPQKLAVQIAFDIQLAQQIYAGSDFFLMPSLFEPCGLGQMIAQRYGTIPLVRQTGGLRDTVKNNTSGLVFKPYQAKALIRSINRAISLFRQPLQLQQMRLRCMRLDHSWRLPTHAYLKVYKKLI